MARFLTLNVGATKALLAEWQQNGTALSLSAYATAELAGGDDPGLLSASLATGIQTIMHDEGIKPAPVVVSLGGQLVFPRFAKFAPVAGGAFDDQVRFEVEQNVPFPIDEIISDFQITGDTVEGDKAALIVAAKREQVNAVTDAVISAGLTPKFVDVAPFAVTNVVRAANPGLDGCNIILDIGPKTTNLILIEDEKVYNRSIPVGNNNLVKDIANKLGLSPDEARTVLAERGYVALGGVTQDEDQLADNVSKIIRAVMTRLHAEISRSINFYRSQQGGSAPSRLFLTGETSRLAQIDQFFSETLQVETQYINPFDIVAFGPRVGDDRANADLYILAEAAGSALRMTGQAAIALNLMPQEIIERARNMQRIPFVVFGAVCVLAALGLGIITENSRISFANARLNVAQENASIREDYASRLADAQKKEKAALEECDSFQRLLASRSLQLRRIEAVRKSLEDKILGNRLWISEWSETSPDVVMVTIRGWIDDVQRLESAWRERNSGDKQIEEIVMDALAQTDAVNMTAEAPNNLVPKGTTVKFGNVKEFTLQIPFKPVSQMVEEPKQKGRKGGAK